MIEQRHHLGDVERSSAEASDTAGRKIMRHAPGLELGPDNLQLFDHLRPKISCEQRQNLFASNLRTERQRFGREQLIECFKVDLGALEFRPGILQMIGGISAPNDIKGQPAFALKPRKSLERRGGQHTAEIPDYCLDHPFPASANAILENG